MLTMTTTPVLGSPGPLAGGGDSQIGLRLLWGLFFLGGEGGLVNIWKIQIDAKASTSARCLARLIPVMYSP